MTTPDAPRPAAMQYRPGRGLVAAVTAWFLAILVLPAVALVAGVRPANLENRALAEPPRLTVSALGTTRFYAAIDTFLTDHLPFREAAATAFGRLSYDVFRDSPNADVVVGADDWLFFRGELRPDCRRSADQAISEATAIGSKLEAQGRRYLFVIAPDKHAIAPEGLGPAARLGTPCSDLRRDAMRAAASARPDLLLDLWTPLLAARDARNPDEKLYWHQDSHWTPSGAIIGIETMVETLQPGVWDPSQVVVRGTADRVGELARLMGLVRIEPVPAIVVSRANKVARTVLDDGAARHGEPINELTSRGPDPVIPGTTVIVYDSFFGIEQGLIAPWFERSIWISRTDLAADPTLGAMVGPFDTLVFESVERQAYGRSALSILRAFVPE